MTSITSQHDTENNDEQCPSSQPQQHKSRTMVDYWDDFYANKTANDVEWIIHPNKSLFDQLIPFLPLSKATSSDLMSATDSCHILEIGCGTSTLARDFFLYLQLLQSKVSDSSLHLTMTATDVSEQAILQNQQRDDKYSPFNSIATTAAQTEAPPHPASLPVKYQVWNVVLNSSEQVFGDHVHFDVLLDKGCLDTILFRTDKRTVSAVASKFLNHVFQALADNGVYLIVTPRRKHALLKLFQGFDSVERIALSEPAAEIYKAQKNTQSYLYACRKRKNYTPRVDSAFIEASSCEQQDAYESCPSCGILQTDFRCQGNNRLREWTGHCKHCKAVRA
jgi:SAM-dependent methyltransferase